MLGRRIRNWRITWISCRCWYVARNWEQVSFTDGLGKLDFKESGIDGGIS